MTQEKRIDFNKLSKPANLQNSAVLRMLEEEEQRKRSGKPDNLKRDDDEISSTEVRDLIRPRSRLRNSWLPFNSNNERSCQTFLRSAAGLRRVEWPPTKEGTIDYVDFVEQNPVQSKTRGQGEYATYNNQSKSPTFREEAAVTSPKPFSQPPNYQASPSQFQEQPSSARSWTPGTPPTSSSQQPKEYIIPVTSSWKNEAPHSSLNQNKPKSWASVAPAAFSPQSPINQQQQQPQEYIVPVSCNWKTESAAAPTSQVSAPKSWSSVQPKEFIVPVSCTWKNEAQTSPAAKFTPSNQSSNNWTKLPVGQFEQSTTSDLPTLNTWKPQSQTHQHRPQIQIKQTPPTPTSNNNNSSNIGWSSDKPYSQQQQQQQQQQFGAWNDYPQQHNLTVSQEVESPQSYYKPQSSAPHFEPPATFITLRAEPPISQEPSPVYHAQPAATEAGYDGSNMRGDQKWPPASVKEQTEAENRARIELAKGPVFRPRKVNKDYSGFFAQHAVTNNYPGYRAPPGTQFFTPAYQH